MNSRVFFVLCIEDEEEVRGFLLSEINRLSNNKANVTFAKSRDEAASILEEGRFFDFITLDLTIPIFHGSFEKSPANGLALLGIAKNICPGTPVLIITGTSTLRMISQFLERSNNVDIWSEGNSRPTVSHLEKTDISEFSERLSPCLAAVVELNEIELSYSFEKLPISHDRLIRIFAKKNGAGFVRVDVIGGGYSDAKVYSLVLNDERGVELYRCIAKCGKRQDIDIDSDNFNKLVSRLKPSATPRQIDHLRYGAGVNSAVFYGFSTEHEHSFFSACDAKLVSNEILESLEEILSNWHDKKVEERRQIKDIRRNLLSDEKFDSLVSLYGIAGVHDFEENFVQCRVSCIHGDLHGENILVDIDNRSTTLIDYGDIMEECAILDPLTLECSFLFHAGSPNTDWPSPLALKKWASIDEYLKDCPYSEEIKFCRQWVNRIGVGNRELAACLYSYALRQLKYNDTDKDRAKELIRVAFDLYNRS